MSSREPVQKKSDNAEPSGLQTDGPKIALTQPITIRIGRNGFAGLTGTEFHIGTDGSWTSSSFINDVTREPDQRGRLSRDALVKLLDVLSESRYGHTIESLPTLIGSRHLNCPITSLAIGTRKITAYISPKEPNARETRISEAFFDIIDRIREIIGA
jgi:hypothetical protein